MRVKCLAQEHNTMSLVSARTQSAQFRDEHTNHKANPVQAIKIPSNASSAFKQTYKIKCNLLNYYQVISEIPKHLLERAKQIQFLIV